MFGLPTPQELAVKFAVGAIVVALAFGAGFYTKGKFDTAAQVVEVKAAQHQTADNVVSAEKVDRTLAFEEDAIKANSNDTKRQLDARLVTHTVYVTKECSNETSQTGKAESVVETGADVRLDVATVRLLNDAREGSADRSTAISDGEGAAPSETTLGTLIDNDTEVVRLYHDLAKRHEALINFVDDLVKKQDQ